MSDKKLKKIIVIVGPTATGKTALAIKLAKQFNGEIINADAFQVYQELNIGTAKATVDERKQAIFHLDDCISIFDEWNIKIFQTKANNLIDELSAKKKMPIIVGGSHLYISALIDNYDLSSSARDDQYDKWDNEKLYKNVLKLDPLMKDKIDANNHRRLVRALQILKQKKNLRTKNKPLYEPIYICTNASREVIYERINKRFGSMIADWKKEVMDLYKKYGYDKLINLQAFKAIGYSNILNAIANNSTIDEEKIKQVTRNYAKKQLTWIRHHYLDCLYYDPDKYNVLIKEINNKLI